MSKPVSERGVLRGLPEYAGEKAQRVALAQTEQDQTVEGGGGLTLSRGSADNTAFRWTAARQSNDAAGLYATVQLSDRVCQRGSGPHSSSSLSRRISGAIR